MARNQKAVSQEKADGLVGQPYSGGKDTGSGQVLVQGTIESVTVHGSRLATARLDNGVQVDVTVFAQE